MPEMSKTASATLNRVVAEAMGWRVQPEGTALTQEGRPYWYEVVVDGEPWDTANLTEEEAWAQVPSFSTDGQVCWQYVVPWLQQHCAFRLEWTAGGQWGLRSFSPTGQAATWAFDWAQQTSEPWALLCHLLVTVARAHTAAAAEKEA